MNENGYPVRQDNGASAVNDAEHRSNTGAQNDVADVREGGSTVCDGCGGAGCPHDLKLAYVYAPDQKFRLLYSAPDALSHGTLFEELYKPMGVYGNE